MGRAENLDIQIQTSLCRKPYLSPERRVEDLDLDAAQVDYCGHFLRMVN